MKNQVYFFGRLGVCCESRWKNRVIIDFTLSSKFSRRGDRHRGDGRKVSGEKSGNEKRHVVDIYTTKNGLTYMAVFDKEII
jgi:hypothetical protein